MNLLYRGKGETRGGRGGVRWEREGSMVSLHGKRYVCVTELEITVRDRSFSRQKANHISLC